MVQSLCKVRQVNTEQSWIWTSWSGWFNSETSILIHLWECALCMLSHFSHIRLCNPTDCSPPVSPVQFCVCACVCVLITQSCPTLCHPMDRTSPGLSVNGILQIRVLEWVSNPSSRGSSQPRVWIRVSCIAGRFLTIWATGGAWSVIELIPIRHLLCAWHWVWGFCFCRGGKVFFLGFLAGLNNNWNKTD